MTQNTSEQTLLLRVYIGESDRYENRPLYRYLVEEFRKRGFSGATVLRGITGFGETSRISTPSILRLSTDLPVVVEVVDDEQKIRDMLPDLEQMVDGGLITLQSVNVLSCHGKMKER